jgi:SH3-like domain-containing protein
MQRRHSPKREWRSSAPASAAPSTEADVLVLLAEATPVFPERSEGEWALVLTPSGTVGWVHQSLLRTR